MRETNVILGLIEERGKKRLPLERVQRLMYNPNLYLTAYGKIYRNQGAMTEGTMGETVEGMSLDKIETIIEALRDGTFQWKPVRGVSIPKKSGKMRPLGIPAWSDKLVQEVIRMLLNAYFEPQFSDHSHGFRPECGCHTALREVKKWVGTAWFIEGDISQCFDKLDHDLLLSILKEYIHDEPFINLLSELLKAGYLEEWKFHATLSGTPQGGIVSPLLANIYLDRLDKYVENELIPAYTRGEKRGRNPEYQKLSGKAHIARREGRTEEAKELCRNKLPIWLNGIIPIRMTLVRSQMDVFHLFLSWLFTQFIFASVENGLDLQTSVCCGVTNEAKNDLIGDERLTLPILGNERKQLVFDFIPFAGSRWEMTNKDLL
jgi:retron-type reverse transcriptase